MTPDLRDLAATIIALPGWEWRPGMRAILPISGRGVHIQDVGATFGICGCPGIGSLPDLTDPATAGAMLGLLASRGRWFQISHGQTVSGATGRLVHGPLLWWVRRQEGADALEFSAPHIGEAIARLVVARGGWR